MDFFIYQIVYDFLHNKYFKIFERNEVFYSLMKEGGEKDGI